MDTAPSFQTDKLTILSPVLVLQVVATLQLHTAADDLSCVEVDWTQLQQVSMVIGCDEGHLRQRMTE